MPFRPTLPAGALLVLFAICAGAYAREPADLAGTWELSVDKAATNCRVLLRADRSDKGNFFLGMPTACRHAMPNLATVGRWGLPDETHLTLDDPAGAHLLLFAADGDGFTAAAGDEGTFTLKRIGAAPRNLGFAPVDENPTGGFTPLQSVATTPESVEPAQPVKLAATRRAKVEADAPVESAAVTPGRYAVMREKRDTGCMLTLDNARQKGGDRAQLAPGCRDQGIVVFDPTAWQVVKGGLVLTARAGHKTRLVKQADGSWAKDPKEGGKPLGLKKL